MRKLGIIVLVVAALIVIAALAVPKLVNINQYHDRIQSELEQKLGRQVSLGQMQLSILPLAVRVDNAVIGEDPRFQTGRTFAQVQELDVQAKLLPLLHRDVQIQSLTLRKPSIEVVRDAQGVWNFASLGKPAAPAPQPPTKPQKPSPPPAGTPSQPAPAQPSKSNEVSISDLKILDGQLALTDLQKHQPRTVYDHIDLSVTGYAPDKPFDISADAHLPGTGAQMLSLSGKAGPIDQNQAVDTPFDGKLKLNQVSISSLEKFLNSPALAGTDATASGETHVRNQGGKLESDGSIALEHPRIRNVDVGYPITAHYSISDDLANDLLHISKGSLKLGSTPLAFSGTVNMKPTPAQLDMQLNASNVSIEEAARLASAVGVAFSPGMTIKGKLNADVHAQGAANQPAMNGTLAMQDLDISGKDLPQAVKVNAIQLALTPQTIRSNDFSAATGTTRVDAQFTLSGYTTSDPNVDASLRTNRANVGELLNIAKAYGASSLEGMSGSGTLTLNVHATGPVKNSAAMTFSGNGQLQNAVLHAPQLKQPLNVANANIGFSSNSVNLQNLSASLGQTHATGNLTLRNFQAPQVQFAIAADKVNVDELEQMLTSGAPQPVQQRKAELSLVPKAYAAAPSENLLTKATGTGTLNIGQVIYDQLLLNNLRSNVTLDHGVVRVAPLTAELYGGQETGSITIDTRPTPMLYTVNTKLERVDANKLISSVSSIKQTLYGLLAANANTTFRSGPADQMARSLNGNLSLDLRNGRIVGMDLMNQLASIGKFTGYSKPAQQFTNLVQLTGNFNVNNGVAQTNNLKAVIDGGTLAAVGAVNLADQTLNLHMTAVLNQAMSKMVGGTGIGGLMQTALANNRGELVIPVLVSGTFQHPAFAPDVQKIAQMRLQNLLPTTNNPGAGILGAITGQGQQGQQGGLSGILGALSGQQQQQQQQQQQKQPVGQQQQQQRRQSNPLGDILNQVFGGQNQNQQQQQDQQQKQR